MAVTINASTSTGLVQTADTSGVLQLQTNSGTTALTIDTSQNVGIGTTSPAVPLAVYKASDSAINIQNSTSGVTNVDGLQLLLSGSNGYMWNYESGANIFGTANTERMRIESTGVVLIGSATVFSGANSKLSALWDPSSQNGFTLKASGTTFSNYAIAFRTSTDTTSGYISQAASTVTYSTSSDYRLKENIAPMTGALNKVALLKPVTYTWKIDGSDGQGFIAHELQEVVPEAVCGEKDAIDADGNIKPQGVDTSFLVATLTAAIQEQQTIINDLKARITALEGAA
jgi:hypothetical protein